MRPSRVHKDISWIEEQFLRGLSVHDFEPAPFEMDQRCVTRKRINAELAACEQSLCDPPPIDHDALVAHTPSTMRMIDCGDEDVRERPNVPIRFRGDGGNNPDHGDDGEPVDDGRFWFGFVVGVSLSVLALFCIQEFAR
jgi:hypothetical protein